MRLSNLKLALSAGKHEHEMGNCSKLHEQLSGRKVLKVFASHFSTDYSATPSFISNQSPAESIFSKQIPWRDRKQIHLRGRKIRYNYPARIQILEL